MARRSDKVCSKLEPRAGLFRATETMWNQQVYLDFSVLAFVTEFKAEVWRYEWRKKKKKKELLEGLKNTGRWETRKEFCPSVRLIAEKLFEREQFAEGQ